MSYHARHWAALRPTRDGQPVGMHPTVGDRCALCGAEDANGNQLSWVAGDWRCEECG